MCLLDVYMFTISCIACRDQKGALAPPGTGVISSCGPLVGAEN